MSAALALAPAAAPSSSGPDAPEASPGAGARLLGALLDMRAWSRYLVRPARAAARARAPELDEGMLKRLAHLRTRVSIVALLAAYAGGVLSPDRAPEMDERMAATISRSYRFVCEHAFARYLARGLPEHDALNRSTIKGVYGALASFVNEEGCCWPSYDALAVRSGFERHVVIRAVAWLAEQGFVIKHKRWTRAARAPEGAQRTDQKNKNNFYTVLPGRLHDLAQLDLDELVELVRKPRRDETALGEVDELLADVAPAGDDDEPTPPRVDQAPPRPSPPRAHPVPVAQSAAAAPTSPEIAALEIPIGVILELTRVQLSAEGVMALGRAHKLDAERMARVLTDVQRVVLARATTGWRWDRASLGDILATFTRTEANGGKPSGTWRRGTSTLQAGGTRAEHDERMRRSLAPHTPAAAPPAAAPPAPAPPARPKDPALAKYEADYQRIALAVLTETDGHRRAELETELAALMRPDVDAVQAALERARAG